MKRTIITAAILSIGVFVNAQTISIGPSGGFGHSWITKADGNNKFNTAWNEGISLIYSTKTNFGLGLDVKYSSEGNKASYPAFTIPEDPPSTVNETINANYVRVPVKLIYFFGKKGCTIRPKIYAGPSFGFLTSGKIINEIDGSKIKLEAKDYFKKFDFGVTAAAGLNFRLATRTWLNTDLAFYQGLSDVSKDNLNSKVQHNGHVGLNIGVLVGLNN